MPFQTIDQNSTKLNQSELLKSTINSNIRWNSYPIKIIALALIYYFLGAISLAISKDSLIVTIVVFASEGFSLAALIILGRRFWLGIFLGQFALALKMGIPLLPATAIGLINSGEAFLGATLFHYFKLDKGLPRLRDVFSLLAIIALVLQPISSILGNFTLLGTSIISWEELSENIFSWWFGNIMGQFLFTPMILLIYANWKHIKQGELFLISLLFAFLSYLIFIAFPIHSLALVFSITMPLMIIISAFRSISHAMIIMTINAFVALFATFIGVGAFSSGNLVNDIIDLNFYILSHILLLLTIGTLFCEQKRIHKQFREMALYDSLTGLPNRNLLEERMNHVTAMTHRFNINSAICFIDIDGFKSVNDTYGHNTGDEVIKTVAQRIKKYIQEDDSLIRLGGDEFLLIAMNRHNKNSVTTLLKQITRSVNQPITIADNTMKVSLSIDVAMCPDDSDSTFKLITLADTAMYKAKNEGKNQFLFYK